MNKKIGLGIAVLLFGNLGYLVYTRGYTRGKSCIPITQMPGLKDSGTMTTDSSSTNDEYLETKVSFARFHRDLLSECQEVRIRWHNSSDAGLEREAEIKNELQKFPSIFNDSTILTRPCAEQFANRKVLATCTVQMENTKENRISWKRYQYSLAEVFRNDLLMKECLEARGQWEAISRNSEEYQKAKMESAQGMNP